MEVNTESPNYLNDNSSVKSDVITWGIVIFLCVFVICVFTFIVVSKLKLAKSTRNMLQGSPPQMSLSQSEPTICIKPAMFPPISEYDAPPSYEEVEHISNLQYQLQIRPITLFITSEIAGDSNATTNAGNTVTSINENNENMSPATVITVTSENSRTVTETTS